LFSRLANFKELSGLGDKYHFLHPKILDLGLRIINEQYSSSNTRCIAMIQALKHFISEFTVPENKSLNRELEEELNKII
jgi:translation initiation factor 2B subunit (eIF-2B alpha/beta/delta family)